MMRETELIGGRRRHSRTDSLLLESPNAIPRLGGNRGANDDPPPPPDDGFLSGSDLHYALLGARCILWRAIVEERESRFRWDLRISHEGAAQRFMPIEVFRNQTYGDAWHTSKLAEDRDRMEQTATEALRSGKPEYTQEFRCRQTDGEIRWLREDVRITSLGTGRWD